jgi:hypothetical protein
MKTINRKIRRRLALGGLVAAIAFAGYIAIMHVLNAAFPSLEPERISHYDPEAIPENVRKLLPPITDPNGMRDTFFFPDGIGKGRVVHMRFPQNYVASALGEPLPRVGDSLVITVVYPEMISVATPAIWHQMYKYGGYLPDGAIEIAIDRPLPNYLTDQVARFLAHVKETKAKFPDIVYAEIPVPSGFPTVGCVGCRTEGLREIIQYRDDPGTVKLSDNIRVTDTYIEWGADGTVTREMRCETHVPRANCGIEIRAGKKNAFYLLAVNFHLKYLNRLSEVIDRATNLVNSSVVNNH